MAIDFNNNKIKNSYLNWWHYFIGSLIIIFYFIAPAAYATNSPTALVLTVNGVIGPATDDYIHRGLHTAIKDNAELVIIKMDTPGGLDKSLHDIVKHILAAPIPVVAFVAPGGAQAASAGTYILYASHIAAMAPGTYLGPATAMLIGSNLAPNTSAIEKPKSETATDVKKTNAAISYIRTLAELRQRNVQWAVQSITNAPTLTAEEALNTGVINIVARNIPDLLQQLEGRKVAIATNHIVTIHTQGIRITTLDPSSRARFIAIITNPSIAYILFLLGIYGLVFEFADRGFIFPGILGGIALIIAIYAFQLLPINYAGLALIIFGMLFLVTEIFVTSFGILGIAAIISFVTGSVLLIEPNNSGYHLPWVLIFIVTVFSLLFLLAIVALTIRTRKRKLASASNRLIGSSGTAVNNFEQEGWVRIHGETWRARSEIPIRKNAKVKVIAVQNLWLTVKPIK